MITIRAYIPTSLNERIKALGRRWDWNHWRTIWKVIEVGLAHCEEKL